MGLPLDKALANYEHWARATEKRDKDEPAEQSAAARVAANNAALAELQRRMGGV